MKRVEKGKLRREKVLYSLHGKEDGEVSFIAQYCTVQYYAVNIYHQLLKEKLYL